MLLLKTLQEQGEQQRKTQQQRFVQNLGQSILGSALQLGTTLGVEHFKETRPSTIAKTDVWKQQSALTKKQVGAFDQKFAAEMKDLGLKANQPFAGKINFGFPEEEGEEESESE